MLRKIWIAIGVLGSLLVGGLWLTAWGISFNRGDGPKCVVAGYAHDDSWLLDFVFYRDGFVLLQHFEPNLSRHRGVFLKTSQAHVAHTLTLRSLFPRNRPKRISSQMTFHLGPPLALFLAIVFLTLGVPVIRRYRRRKRGRCMHCGYDLRGGSSRKCSECGMVNDHVAVDLPAQQPHASDPPVGE